VYQDQIGVAVSNQAEYLGTGQPRCRTWVSWHPQFAVQWGRKQNTMNKLAAMSCHIRPRRVLWLGADMILDAIESSTWLRIFEYVGNMKPIWRRKARGNWRKAARHSHRRIIAMHQLETNADSCRPVDPRCLAVLLDLALQHTNFNI
jgi:hypothetical protein